MLNKEPVLSKKLLSNKSVLNKSRSQTQPHPARRNAQDKPQRNLDERIRRTRARLGNALVELIQEKPVNAVTVQDVLDRASVGRSTFYLHYRDKDDLLLSQLETFLESMSSALSLRAEQLRRLVPVEEFFAHIGSATKLYRVLADSGHLKDFFDLAQGYFARGIEQRLTQSKSLSKLSQRELAPRASALAGSLLSLLQWWLSHGAKESPRDMDRLFHDMAWKGLP